jgi:hypothetical protein
VAMRCDAHSNPAGLDLQRGEIAENKKECVKSGGNMVRAIMACASK